MEQHLQVAGIHVQMVAMAVQPLLELMSQRRGVKVEEQDVEERVNHMEELGVAVVRVVVAALRVMMEAVRQTIMVCRAAQEETVLNSAVVVVGIKLKQEMVVLMVEAVERVIMEQQEQVDNTAAMAVLPAKQETRGQIRHQ